MVESMGADPGISHHKKKLAFVFSAMRHFAAALRADGWRVDYLKCDQISDDDTMTDMVGRALAERDYSQIHVTEPGEWQLRMEIGQWSEAFGLPVSVLDDNRYISSRQDFAAWADGRKQLRMENFYRRMRVKTGLLMHGDKPVGGRWNFDVDNRRPASGELDFPAPPTFPPDAITREVLATVGTRYAGYFGNLEPFWFATDAEQAEAALDHFVDHALPSFGDYQDAMLRDQRFMYHALLSHYINIGLLDALQVCRAAERAFQQGAVPLNAAEGFIRQIIGWREYVRGVYWLEMPEYLEMNAFQATRDLPAFYWTGETDMACVRTVVEQTRDEAYAHHIQRLMITGNFALLAGIDPKQVHEWYLGVYADAHEWVELPNTLGMSQFADGGRLASKPYAASGNYINKMSDYCRSCPYDVKIKTGAGACPFNALYWDFLDRNRHVLGANPRLAHPYRTWDRMASKKKAAYRDTAAMYLDRIDGAVSQGARL